MKRLSYSGEDAADTRFHDGALRYVRGACHVQIMRANREHPELGPGTDFTYNHAPMLCRWRGKFHLMYLSSPIHEHDGLARAMLTESVNGFDWSRPRVVFPDIPVPMGIYRGKGAEKLRDGARTVVHHRMGFYCAENGVLLVMTHHGVTPDIHVIPNSGYGMGRVVRRIGEDGSVGEIFVLRINEQAGWKLEHFPYRFYTASEDRDFVDACDALLHDHAANGAWWEEERLDEGFFPLKNVRAPSFCTLSDGMLGVVGKMGVSSVSEDGGCTWPKPEKAAGVISSGGKCLLTRTGDGRYALVYNPSPDGQHRWPLAVATSEDGYTYDHMYCAGGDVAPMRYGGYLKNFGLNYIRGMMPGNDDAPDGYTWTAYSMNKEDIWVMRLPRTIAADEPEDVHEDFATMTGRVPDTWYTYSPLWAKVTLEHGALTLRDSEPCDYAKAVRNLHKGKNVTVTLRLMVQGGSNGSLQIELSDGKGMNAARLTLSTEGQLLLRGGDGEWPVGTWRDGEPLTLIFTVDCVEQRVTATINGCETKAYPLMCPVLWVERLTMRTGATRIFPTPEDNLKNVCTPDIPGAGERLPEAVYSLYSVDSETR